MKFAIQDSETGEIGYFPERLELHCTQYDEETGEPIITDINNTHFHKTKFNVPKEYLKNTISGTRKKKILRRCENTYPLRDKEKLIQFKEEIILGYNKTSHRLFLIPSLFLFTKLTALLISISEILLHVWAHRKNSRNTNPNIYYRSPLHVLTSQFCALCRAQSERDHICKLQDRSRRLHENFKQMTRTLT